MTCEFECARARGEEKTKIFARDDDGRYATITPKRTMCVDCLRSREWSRDERPRSAAAAASASRYKWAALVQDPGGGQWSDTPTFRVRRISPPPPLPRPRGPPTCIHKPQLNRGARTTPNRRPPPLNTRPASPDDNNRPPTPCVPCVRVLSSSASSSSSSLPPLPRANPESGAGVARSTIDICRARGEAASYNKNTRAHRTHTHHTI